MKRETFYEHALRRMKAGDSKDELQALVEEAEEALEKENLLSESEAKALKEADYSSRSKKAWETRRKNAEAVEIQAKKDAFPL